MVNGLLTGEIQAGWFGIPNVMELIAAGKLRGLCVSILQRSIDAGDCDLRRDGRDRL
jgi:tripartite-type tricarboxylate transporter receptor subunit TctC